jgi:PPOX class probable F420-dependent enzyme
MAGIDWESDLGRRARQRLESEKAIWLTTVAPDGTPQPNPVWFTWDGETILVYSYRSAVRNRNLETNRRVAVNFDSERGESDVHTFTGTARFAPDEPPVDRCQPYIDKYLGYIREELKSNLEDYASDYSVPVRITLERLRGFN